MKPIVHKPLLCHRQSIVYQDSWNRRAGKSQVHPEPTDWFTPSPANLPETPQVSSLLFRPWCVLPVFHSSVQHTAITGTCSRCHTCPDYINAHSHKMTLDSGSGSNYQPGCFHSNYTQCIIFTLSCCHKHFGLRCSAEHLVYPAR